MNTQKHQSGASLQREAILKQLNEQGLRKDQLNKLIVSPRLKSSQLLVPPNIRVHHLERREDGTLWCRECGRTHPSTRRGMLDTKKLVREISLP